MDLVVCSVILLLIFGSNLAAKHDSEKVQFDELYKNLKNGRSKIGYPNRRRTQLYSRNTGRFIQVMPKGKVVAQGMDGDKYADLEILTVSFGKVHIRSLETSLYICFDKRGRLIAKKRETARCVFREQHGKDAYTMYESEEFNGKFIAFSRKGVHRYKAESKFGTKAVQFVERPRSEVIRKNSRHLRYYTSRGKKGRITPRMFANHKMAAQKTGRWSHLYSQNNPALNPLHNGKSTKKNRKNKHKKKKHNSKKSDEKNINEKQQEETKDNEKFPPKGRLGGKKEEKDSE